MGSVNIDNTGSGAAITLSSDGTDLLLNGSPIGGGGGSTIVTGTATIDFGAAPGANEASVAVTGQTSILATSKVQAWIMADDTSVDHTASDHRYFPVLASLTCGTPSAGTGFTIYARSTQKLTGEWSVRFLWTN